MKQIKITPPEGYIIDRDLSTFEHIIFKKVEQSPTPQLPKSWEELNNVIGYFTDSFSSVEKLKMIHSTEVTNKNIFSSEQEARASIALAQLSQLRKVYRNGWEPDYANSDPKKYGVFKVRNGLIVDYTYTQNIYLSFQDQDTAVMFLKNFKDLIEEASPLLFG